MVRSSQMSDAYKKHILIVNDSYDSRILLKTLLEATGYTTECTSNGAEALNKDLFATYRPKANKQYSLQREPWVQKTRTALNFGLSI